MRKPESLRAALAAALPALPRNPDRLRIWVGQGSAHATHSPTQGFSYKYRLSVFLVELAADPSLVFMAIADWLRVHQPELLHPNYQRGFEFQVDVLDNDSFDLLIELELTENVLCTPDGNGGYTMEYPGEPDPLFPDDQPYGDPGLLKTVCANGDEIIG